jgi:hypothetical protein
MSRAARVFLATACLLSLELIVAFPAASHPAASHPVFSLEAACRAAAAERLQPYPWPLKPFRRQHPVRGYFGDPRTVIYTRGLGLFSFHNGIDISAWTGNAVYPVLSGVVVRVERDRVVVRSSHGRRFQYVHVKPRVRIGSVVFGSRTVLGNVPRRWEHVHLTEMRGRCAVNPLAPGHLAPYRDRTDPTVADVYFSTPAGVRLDRRHLHGLVQAVAQAEDTPALRGRGVWRGMPVAPALVRWTISTPSGRRVAGGTATDFRATEPPPQDFCRIYAPGTIQNFAADDGHYHWGQRGRYLFRLTTVPFDAATLASGRYRFTVMASDTAGNNGKRTVVIQIDNHGYTVDRRRAHPDWRCQSRTLTVAHVHAFRRLHHIEQAEFRPSGLRLAGHPRREVDPLRPPARLSTRPR